MRLIDADALKVNVARMSGDGDYVERVWYDIDRAPTVDAVKVVRCKDCTCYNGNNHYCDNDHYAVFNGYCYNGTEKEMSNESG